MMNFLRKHQYKITIALVVVMVLWIFAQLGGEFFLSRGGGDAIAEVNGQKIPLRTFYSHYQTALDQAGRGQALEKAVTDQKRDETIRDMVQAVVFAEQAKRYGIHVPDKQVAISITQIPAFQEKGVFNGQRYMQALQSQVRMSPKDFEEEQRNSIAFFKLRWLIQSAIKITDKELEMQAAFKQAGKPFKSDKEKNEFRQTLWQEKIMSSFNEWFGQIGRNLKVKTHLELLGGAK